MNIQLKTFIVLFSFLIKKPTSYPDNQADLILKSTTYVFIRVVKLGVCGGVRFVAIVEVEVVSVVVEEV